MAVKLDPLTETRRQAFRKYCKDKGWQNPGGTWQITSIAEAVGKARTKVSDLLNGTGTFGAKIARDLEERLNLPLGSFDAFGGAEPGLESILRLQPVEAQLVQMYRGLSPQDQRRALELVNGLLKRPAAPAVRETSSA